MQNLVMLSGRYYHIITQQKKTELELIGCYIVTGRYNDKIRKVINQFNLPIEVYVMSKQNVLKVIN